MRKKTFKFIRTWFQKKQIRHRFCILKLKVLLFVSTATLPQKAFANYATPSLFLLRLHIVNHKHFVEKETILSQCTTTQGEHVASSSYGIAKVPLIEFSDYCLLV